VDAGDGLERRLHGAWCIARAGRRTTGRSLTGRSESGVGLLDLNVNGTMYVLKHSARRWCAGGGRFVSRHPSRSRPRNTPIRWFGPYGGEQVGARPHDAVAAETRSVVGAGQQQTTGIDPHGTGRPRPGIARAERDYRLAPHCRGGRGARMSPTSRCSVKRFAASYVTGQVSTSTVGSCCVPGPDFSARLEPVSVADGLRGGGLRCQPVH